MQQTAQIKPMAILTPFIAILKKLVWENVATITLPRNVAARPLKLTVIYLSILWFFIPWFCFLISHFGPCDVTPKNCLFRTSSCPHKVNSLENTWFVHKPKRSIDSWKQTYRKLAFANRRFSLAGIYVDLCLKWTSSFSQSNKALNVWLVI